MNRRLTARSSLQSLRKEAKRWLKALREHDREARARLQRTWARAPDVPGLREVQHALALEYGLPNWAALKAALAEIALARRSDAERADEFLEHACLNYGVRPDPASWDPRYSDSPSRRRYAARILERHPDIAHHSLHTAVVCADLAEVERVLSQQAQAVHEAGGPHRRVPLLYLCYGRLPVAAANDNTVAIARLLLDAGADPNACFSDGTNRFTALTGVIGEGEGTPAAVPPHPRARELAELLLERGADPLDLQALYNTSLWHDEVRWLDVLHGHSVRAGESAKWNQASGRAEVGKENTPLNYLLGHAVANNHPRRVEWLLAHGADPDARQANARRSLHAEAALRGFTQIEDLLRRFGAQPTVLEGREAFQAACMRLDCAEAGAIARRHPEYLRGPEPLMAAVSAGREDALALLLDLGVPVNLEDSDGARALHHVTWTDAVATARRLIAHGADIDCRERRFGATPLGWALHLDRPGMVELLVPLSRDVHSLARAGAVDRLREVLDAEPALANLRVGDCTPLFSLPEGDEDRACEVIAVLLAHGADPGARNRDGLTPAEHAQRQGLVDAADLLQSSRDRA
jgi:ankyrin repeat protein